MLQTGSCWQGRPERVPVGYRQPGGPVAGPECGGEGWPGVLEVLDASAIRRWSALAARALADRRAEIDDLNVYPVPDGDTGTNLAQTLRSAADAAAEDSSADAGGVLRAMAKAAVLGAQGNSGVIVSQVLCGLADGFDGAATGDGALLTSALRHAADTAWTAVSEPVEGTILSVARAAADAAEAAPDGLAHVITAAVDGAAAALGRTPDQLEVLAAAGVVDAGGRGLVVLLEALSAVVAETESSDGETLFAAPDAHREPAPDEPYGFEVQYLLHAEPAAVAELKRVLAGLGDSLVVVGTGDGVFNVHVHVDDVGAAIEAGLAAGRPHRISVVHFGDQQARRAQRHAPATSDASTVISIGSGAGLAEVFRSEGALVLAGVATAAEILDVVRAAGTSKIILLPTADAGSEIGAHTEVAAAHARDEGLTVAVVPTRSPVQGLAAVAVHDATRRFDDNVIALAEAAAATRFAEVTVAVAESITYAGHCKAGDVLGLIDGEVVEIGGDILGMGISLASRLIAAGGELVTVLGAADANGAADAVADWVRIRHPLVEVSAPDGATVDARLLIGVE